MAEVKWIKITTGMFDDEKIKIIQAMPEGDSILVIWIKLLVTAGKCNADGYVYLSETIPYTEEMLSTIFNKPLVIVRLSLKTFLDLGMIEVDNKGIFLCNWQKHQNINGLEEIREYNRLAKQKERERKKQLSLYVNDESMKSQRCQGTDIDLDLDKDKDKDKNNNINIVPKIPPDINDVRKYCEERKNKIDPEYFWDYYQARDWKMTNGKKMKDWRAAVRTWERNNYQNRGEKIGTIKPDNRTPTWNSTEEQRRYNSRGLDDLE